ncbi:YbaK/EbsC family protein [Thermanaerosceptrum fracticalcis]|uniref:YbaK/EbsC family protein n=1 Tax=Thermanaerosceptrum fracticalcis TaxID=1712410 RepID=A0A7G6E0E0_THEFR|nr:YbaK/EbsC family protein [Thermanaerosceptrum fracticalcis]
MVKEEIKVSPLEKVREYMKTLPFSLEIILFNESTHTSQLAAQALGVEVGQIAKTLVFVGKDSQAVLVVTSGDMKVDQKKLKEVAGFKPRFASAEEALALTGFPPGGVCPFAVPVTIPVFIDVSLERFPVVYAAAGTANSAVPITVPQLMTATRGNMCDVCYC